MLNTAETLLERQVPGAGKLSEFPDGSRIYTAAEDETLSEIAGAFGIDAHELMMTNLENYAGLTVDAPLCEGTLLELPKLSESAGSEARNNAKNIEAGLLGWIPIYVYGSGEKSDQRTDGLLFECDKKYTVACNGREMKLSEFCQYAGNKKNRPRECIIITETQETLVDYEARRAPSLSEGLQKHDATGDQSNGATESTEKFLAREMKIVDVPDEGSVVKVGSIVHENRRVGVIKERSADGWYKVVMVDNEVKPRSSPAEEIEVRAYHIEQTPVNVQRAELELWAVDFLRAVSATADTFGTKTTKLKTIQDSLVSEMANLREAASKSGFKPPKFVHSLVHTVKPKDWQQAAEAVQSASLRRAPGEGSFCSRIADAIRARNALGCFNTPLTCQLAAESKNTLEVRDVTGIPSTSGLADEDAATAKTKLKELVEKRKRLASELEATSQKREEVEEAERAMALAQDQEAAANFCARHYELAGTMLAADLECKISRDLTILLRDLVAFQGASRLALRLLCVQKLLNALERDLSFLSERLRNESYFGRELGLLSTAAPGEVLDSSTYWKFCASELQGSAEYRALTLKAAKRIQRHCSTVLSTFGPEPQPSFMVPDVGHDNKTLSATFGSGSIRWHAEAEGMFYGAAPSSVVRGLQASNQQSKPKVPELVEAGTHSVVLRFLVLADEYQVAWEKGCQHSRGTAWLNPLRATDALYTVTGLAPATEYRFRFRAFHSGVWGEWSKAVLYSTVSESAAKCDLLTFASTELEDVPVLQFWFARNTEDEVLRRNLGNKTADADLFQKSQAVAFRKLHSSTVSLIEKLEAAARSSEAHGHRNLALVSLSSKPQRLGGSISGTASSGGGLHQASNEHSLTPAQLLAAFRPPQNATPGGDPVVQPAVSSKKSGKASISSVADSVSIVGRKPALASDGQRETERPVKRTKNGIGLPVVTRPLSGAGSRCVGCPKGCAVGKANLCPACLQAVASERPKPSQPPGSISSLPSSAHHAASPTGGVPKPLVNPQRKQLSMKLAIRGGSHAAEPGALIRLDPSSGPNPLHGSGKSVRLQPSTLASGPPAAAGVLDGASPLAGQKRGGQSLAEDERPSKR